MPITGLACKARVVVSDQEEESWGPQGQRDEHTPKGAQGLELVRLELRSLHKVRISERATSWSISTSPLVAAELGCVSWACQSHKELTDKGKTHLETHCCKWAEGFLSCGRESGFKICRFKMFMIQRGHYKKNRKNWNRIRILFPNSRNLVTWMRNSVDELNSRLYQWEESVHWKRMQSFMVTAGKRSTKPQPVESATEGPEGWSCPLSQQWASGNPLWIYLWAHLQGQPPRPVRPRPLLRTHPLHPQAPQ